MDGQADGQLDRKTGKADGQMHYLSPVRCSVELLSESWRERVR